MQYFSPPPRWLPLRLLLGGVIAAVVLLLTQQRGLSTLFAWDVPAPGLWTRCGASLIVLVIALLLALSIGLAAGLLARRMGPRVEMLVAFFGRALACLPIAAVAWGFIGGWIGHLGWPVETLLPAQLPEAAGTWQTMLARELWEFLAPALVLALPLCGEVIQCVITDATATADLDFSLRARGVPHSSRLWVHHLRQLLPLLRVRMQSLCLIAPVYLIIVEDVLRFMGWGGWMAQSIRAGDVSGIAHGFIACGAMLALLCVSLFVLRGKLKSPSSFMPALAWHPWFLWALGAMTLPNLSAVSWLILWLAVLVASSAAWHQAWNSIEDQLPIDASRVLGASEGMIWLKHIAPVQFRMLAAWVCAVFAQTLLWIAVACAVQPRLLAELGDHLAQWCRPLAIASMQDAAQTLADPAAMLHAGGSIALAALCLIQVSRIVQPRPT
ncbi:hypothetical protein [Prosthecobacter sp.]|uniref:hypothetical protein n=1 Tax=Prosthecobacter sp. TaxID=1965333 RepID=UPI003904B2B6